MSEFMSTMMASVSISDGTGGREREKEGRREGGREGGGRWTEGERKGGNTYI